MKKLRKPDEYTPEEQKRVDALISGAAEATEYFGDDALERYVEKQRRRDEK